MFNQKYEEWLEELYRPIKGGDGEDDDDTSTSSESGTGDDTTSENEDTSTDDTTAGGDEDDNDSAGSGNDADEDELNRVKTEREEMRQRLAKAEAAARKAKDEARRAREEAARKHGNWEQVAKERQAEIDELNERLQASDADKVTAQNELDSFRRDVRITRLATKLGFRDPQDAIVQLKDQPESTADDKSCERSLRKLAENKPYLVDQKRAHGRSMNGNTGAGMPLSHEQMKNMTPEEINAHWEQVAGSLSGSGSG